MIAYFLGQFLYVHLNLNIDSSNPSKMDYIDVMIELDQSDGYISFILSLLS